MTMTFSLCSSACSCPNFHSHRIRLRRPQKRDLNRNLPSNRTQNSHLRRRKHRPQNVLCVKQLWIPPQLFLHLTKVRNPQKTMRLYASVRLHQSITPFLFTGIKPCSRPVAPTFPVHPPTRPSSSPHIIPAPQQQALKLTTSPHHAQTPPQTQDISVAMSTSTFRNRNVESNPFIPSTGAPFPNAETSAPQPAIPRYDISYILPPAGTEKDTVKTNTADVNSKDN